MRICENCGAQIPDGDLFCPSCLAEVQLVPDYETLESRVQENRIKEEEEAAQRQQEAMRAAEFARQKKRRRKILITLILVAVIAVVLTVVAMYFIRIDRQNHSFSWQFEQAQTAFEAGDMNLALEHVRNALEIEPENESAGILLARIYEETDNPGKAAQEYERVISFHPGSEEAYARLVPIYQKQKLYDELQTLLANCTDDGIRATYADYVTYEPIFDLKEGQYESIQELNFTGFEEGAGDVYYTIDGTTPTTESLRYSSPIRIDEGNTTVQAFYQSPAGIPSHIVKQEYRIRLRRAEAPLITPDSGTYRSESPVWITVEVPDGYEAHYAFDERPTAASERYEGPVQMPSGDHIFYAVLVDENGKEGEVGTATYVYRRLTPTPTPTPTPIPTPAPSVTPTTVVTPTPAPTATPTATPTPTQGPDDTTESTVTPSAEVQT